MKKITCLIVLVVLFTLGCSQAPPPSTDPIITPRNIEPLSKEIVRQQLTASHKNGLSISDASWSISVQLVTNGADEQTIEDINEKIYPKVKYYMQLKNPSQVATKSYVNTITSIIRENLQ